MDDEFECVCGNCDESMLVMVFYMDEDNLHDLLTRAAEGEDPEDIITSLVVSDEMIEELSE